MTLYELLDIQIECTQFCLIELYKSVFSSKIGDNWWLTLKKDADTNNKLDPNDLLPIAHKKDYPEELDFRDCMKIILYLKLYKDDATSTDDFTCYYRKYIFDDYKIDEDEEKTIRTYAFDLNKFYSNYKAHKGINPNTEQEKDYETAISKMESIVKNFKSFCGPDGISFYEKMIVAHSQFNLEKYKKFYSIDNVFPEQMGDPLLETCFIKALMSLGIEATYDGKIGFYSASYEDDKTTIERVAKGLYSAQNNGIKAIKAAENDNANFHEEASDVNAKSSSVKESATIDSNNNEDLPCITDIKDSQNDSDSDHCEPVRKIDIENDNVLVNGEISKPLSYFYKRWLKTGFDEDFINAFHIQNIDSKETERIKNDLTEELEVRIGKAISEGLNDEQLKEFDSITDAKEAAAWLEENKPDFRTIVVLQRKQLFIDILEDWSSGNGKYLPKAINRSNNGKNENPNVILNNNTSNETITPDPGTSNPKSEEGDDKKRFHFFPHGVIICISFLLVILVVGIITGKKSNSQRVDNYRVSLDDFSLVSSSDDEYSKFNDWGNSGEEKRQILNSQVVNNGVLGDNIVFNSIIDSKVGDERKFVGAKLFKGSQNTFASLLDRKNEWTNDVIEVKDGDIYTVCIYVDNDNPKGMSAVSEDTSVLFSLPPNVSRTHKIVGYIDSTNADPWRCWDTVTFYSDDLFYLAYLEDSAKYTNRNIGTIDLNNNAILTGADIGFDSLDGKIPGGDTYAGIATINLAVHKSVAYRLHVQVRMEGTKEFQDSLVANIGDTVEFQIEYVNFLGETVHDVMIRDVLPDNIDYIEDSTVLYDSNHQDGILLSDNSLTIDGINIGDHSTKRNSYIRFKGKIVDKSLATGSTSLRNWVKASANNEAVYNCVDIYVNK